LLEIVNFLVAKNDVATIASMQPASLQPLLVKIASLHLFEIDNIISDMNFYSIRYSANFIAITGNLAHRCSLR